MFNQLSFYKRIGFFAILILLLSLGSSWLVAAQDGSLTSDAVDAARAACRTLTPGQICYGSAALKAAFEAAATFDKPGDITSLDGLQSLTGAAANTKDKTWGIALLKLSAGLPADVGAATLAAVGDSQLKNVAQTGDVTICTAKNISGATLNVFAGPALERPVVGTLTQLEKVSVNGRTEAGDWLRLERDGSLGWVLKSAVAVDCEPEKLAVGKEGDVSILYRQPMQALTLENKDTGSTDTPNGLLIQSPLGGQARFLVDGVQIDSSGAAFVNASADTLTVSGLQGQTILTAGGKSVSVKPGFAATVALSSLQASGAPSEPAETKTESITSLLNSLIYGQPFGKGIDGFSISSTQTQVGKDDLVKVNMAFTGDSSVCAAGDTATPVDVVFAVDTSNSISEVLLAASQASVGEFIQQLRPRTDQVGVIGFSTGVKVVSPFGENLNNAISGLVKLRKGGGTAIDRGLNSAYSELKSAVRPDSTKAVILITDGGSDPQSALTIANEIKAAGIRVITIGVGQDADTNLLEKLASDKESFWFASSPINLPGVLRSARLSLLVNALAARDLTLTYKLNSDYKLVENLLDLSGGKLLDKNTIQWKVSKVQNAETVTFPVIVQPTKTGTNAVGTAELSYLACSDGDKQVSGSPVEAPNVEVSSSGGQKSDVVSLEDGILASGSTGEATIGAFNQHSWILNIPGDQVVSVITEGVPGALNAAIANPTIGAINPLYTLSNFDGNERNLSVFYVPESKASFLSLQSSSQTTVGTYKVTVKTGLEVEPAATLTPDGDPIQDKQSAYEGKAYLLKADPDSRVTLRWTYTSSNPSFDDRLDVVDLTGTVLKPLSSIYDAPSNQTVNLYSLTGKGPYHAVVKLNVPYTLQADAGDTLTNARGPIQVGETRDKDAKSSGRGVFSYDLELPKDELISIALSGQQVFFPTLLDEKNQEVKATSQSSVNSYALAQYNLTAGKYSLYVIADGKFGISVADGDITRSLKGSISFSNSQRISLRPAEKLAVYNISEGSKKPLAAGDFVTVTVDATEVDQNNVFIESSDGNRAVLPIQPIVDTVDRTTKRFVSVYELKGKGPYRIIVTGISNFLIDLERGDLLSSNKGSIVLGQTLRDSSRAPQYLIYTVAPQLGKNLVEGDIITVNFLNQANADKPFFVPFLQDAKENEIDSDSSYSSQRQFVGVYTLQGQPPYKLFIPNIGAYVVSVNIGDRLARDGGDISVGDSKAGATSGPQRVSYALNAAEGQTFTVTVSQGGRSTASGSDYNLVILDANNIPVIYKWSIYNTGFVRQVYKLSGVGPFHVSFQMNGTYSIKIEDGDKLTLDQGKFYLGDADATQVKPELNDQFVVYQLDLKAGQTITAQVGNASFYPSFSLTGADGFEQNALYNWYSYTAPNYNTQRVFNIRETGTYTLSFVMRGKYTIRVTEGEVPKVVKGNVFFGVTETDQLKTDKRYASYTINADEGETISLEYLPARGSGKLESAQLTNANGEVIFAQDSLSEGDYVISTYALFGPGPYTLLLEPHVNTQYKMTVRKGDVFNVDRGDLAFNNEDDFSPYPIPDPKKPADNSFKPLKRMTYTFEGEAGKSVTFQITEPQRTLVSNLHLFDAGGNEIAANGSVFESGKRILTVAYDLTGVGPYHYTLQAREEYKLLLSDGNVLVADQGELPYDLKTENQLKAPVVKAVYSVDGKPGDIVSIQVEGRFSGIAFVDANGTPVTVVDQFSSSSIVAGVYELSGSAPYRFTITPNNNTKYGLTLTKGNALYADLGPLEANKASDLADPKFKPVTVTGTLDAPKKYAIYSLDGKAGDVITLQLKVRTLNIPLLTNSDGGYIDPQTSFFDRDNVRVVYVLTGSAPYKLLFDAPDRYEITLYEGDVLRFDAGTIPTGVQAEPYKNTLPALARIAIHTLDVAPGQLVTVQLENKRNVIASQLIDGNGKIIEPVASDFQGGQNNVNVYILSGSGPYKLIFPVDGEYTASVEAANLLRVDKGTAAFATPIEDELADPGRVATYLVEGKRDQLVTIQLQAGSKPADGEFRDANGKLWLPDTQIIQNNVVYNVYKLGGPPPYDITFTPDKKYAMTVSDGNLLRVELGNVTLDEKISTKLEAPGRVAVYSVDVQPGETISTSLQITGRPADSQLYNADGELLLPKTTVQKNNTTYAVYEVAGKAPYRLEFIAPGQYNLTVSQGNVLRSEEGSVALGEKVSKSLKTPASIAVYTVDVEAGQLLSTQLQVGGRAADSTLFDADGNKQEPVVKLDKLNSTIKVFMLTGKGPYTLEFRADSQYNLTVSKGNVLRADQGVIRFDNTATDTLKQPAEAAIYTIDAQPGDVISLQLQDRNRPIDSELHDADGKLVLPYGKANTNNASYSAYKLDGKSPYQLTFLPGGRYSLTLKRGNAFRVEQGVIPFGQTITDRLPAPGVTAIYTLKTESNQVISAQIVNRGRNEFVQATLRDSDGNVIQPIRVVFDGSATSTSVYVLSGSAPYTFEFNIPANYSITFSRGDVTDPKLKQVGPPNLPTP